MAALLASALLSHGEIKVVVERNDGEHATADFKFKNIPRPSSSDAASQAAFVIVDGRRDPNGGDLDVLHNGRVPAEDDQPSENLFFRAGTDGGRLLIDLGAGIEIKQINTYSWHPNTRGPQVYHLYASDGKGEAFNAQPKRGTEPEKCGWKLIAKVDTRSKDTEAGGQYGVSIADPDGSLGKYRYLLFDIFRTEDTDGFGNTFYSEIDVLDRNAPAVVEAPMAQPAREIVEADGGKYEITVDTSETPDLTEWAHQQLAPVVREWYPKIADLLPSEGYAAPRKVSIVFKKDMAGVADTAGTRIRCAAKWFRQNLKGEAIGSVVHELVHAVQQYGQARRTNPNATRSPGWLVEGMADYVRWCLYEPQSHGAEVTRRGLARAKYDASYRVSANFLDWVTKKYDKSIVEKLNAALRTGNYNEELWRKQTGHTVQELGDEWKKALEAKLAPPPSAATSNAVMTAQGEPGKTGQ